MKKMFVFVMLVLTLALGVSTIAAQGQDGTDAPGVWGSSVNLQNVGTGEATISIEFFAPDGTSALVYTPDPLAMGDAVSIYVPGVVTALAGGQYSAVVSSDQPVVASVNTGSTNSGAAPWTAFGYDGFDSSQAGATLYFPGNYNDYYNFHSELVIQNTGATVATVTADFLKSDGTAIGATVDLGTIPAYSSQTYPMSAFGALPTGGTGLFGVVINATQDVVGIANIWRENTTYGTASYSGFTSGGANLYAPGLYKEYYGFVSAMTVQNVGTGTADGVITYSNGITDTFSLAEGAAQEFYQPNNAGLPSGNSDGVFAASVETTSGEVVGLVSLSSTAGAGDFASYNVPDTASATVNIPNINSNYYGYFSAVTVQNTSSVETDITITYPDGQSREFLAVAGGDVVNILHLDSAGNVLPNTSTSAVVTSTGADLVAVIQHNTSNGVVGYDPSKTPSDYLMAVTGLAVTP